MKTFTDKLIDAMREKQSILCVGLDPQIRFMPSPLAGAIRKEFAQSSEFCQISQLFYAFNKKIIDGFHSNAVEVRKSYSAAELVSVALFLLFF